MLNQVFQEILEANIEIWPHLLRVPREKAKLAVVDKRIRPLLVIKGIIIGDFHIADAF
jgi:hypothetical protein